MGILLSKTMDDNLKKQHEFGLSLQQLQVERQLLMENEIRERQMAFAIASSRDFFWYWITFDIVISTVLIAGAVRNKRLTMLIPLIPLNSMAAYHWDNAYGPKFNRGMADQILDKQNYLLELPHGLPTFASIETARLEQKNSASPKSGNDILL
ncbi:hypothetical protein BsWGS_19953 [Bradybaena similaris]